MLLKISVNLFYLVFHLTYCIMQKQIAQKSCILISIVCSLQTHVLIFDIFHTQMELLFLIKEMNHRNVVFNFHNVQLCNKVLCKDPKEQQHLIYFWNRLKVYWLNLMNFIKTVPTLQRNIVTNF